MSFWEASVLMWDLTPRCMLDAAHWSEEGRWE